VFSYCSVFILISSFLHSVHLVVRVIRLVFCIFSLILLTLLFQESVVIHRCVKLCCFPCRLSLILISFVLIEALLIEVLIILQLVIVALIGYLTRSSVVSVVRLVGIPLCLRMDIILSIIIIVGVSFVLSLLVPFSTVLE
jgi:hypothetical protein